MRRSSILPIVLAVAALHCGPARAEVRRVTVGVHTTCPYGLVA